MRCMPRARGTKSRSRVAAFHDLEEAAGKRGAKGRALSVNVTRLGQASRCGTCILRRPAIVDRFSYSFKRGDRIGLWDRTVSKEHLHRTHHRGHAPDKGKVTIGDTVVLGHYDQQVRSGRRKSGRSRWCEIAEAASLNKGRELTAAQLLERFPSTATSNGTRWACSEAVGNGGGSTCARCSWPIPMSWC